MVPAALAAVRPTIPFSKSTNPDDLLRTTKKRPAIVVVTWTGGSKHYVVAAGPNERGDQLIVLDPFYGVQSAPIGPTGLGSYRPVDSTGKVLATGTWDNWVCKVD
jgi:hypothetical protein